MVSPSQQRARRGGHAVIAQVPDSGEAPPVDEMTATESRHQRRRGNRFGPIEPCAGRFRLHAQPNAPKSYTVKRGDTLWGIASTFLRDPWYGLSLVYQPQVANPHLIYLVTRWRSPLDATASRSSD